MAKEYSIKNHRRYGKFRLSMYLIEHYPELVKAVMAECVIIRAEAMFEYDAIHYHAWSDHFAPVPLGGKAPIYLVDVRETIHGCYEVKFK